MSSVCMQMLGQGLQVMPLHIRLFGCEDAVFLAILEDVNSAFNFYESYSPEECEGKVPEFNYSNYNDLGFSFDWFLGKFEKYRDANLLDYQAPKTKEQKVIFKFYYHMIAHFISRADIRKETPECFHKFNEERYGKVNMEALK